jgi:hypothetical protein
MGISFETLIKTPIILGKNIVKIIETSELIFCRV